MFILYIFKMYYSLFDYYIYIISGSDLFTHLVWPAGSGDSATPQDRCWSWSLDQTQPNLEGWIHDPPPRCSSCRLPGLEGLEPLGPHHAWSCRIWRPRAPVAVTGAPWIVCTWDASQHHPGMPPSSPVPGSYGKQPEKHKQKKTINIRRHI